MTNQEIMKRVLDISDGMFTIDIEPLEKQDKAKYLNTLEKANQLCRDLLRLGKGE